MKQLLFLFLFGATTLSAQPERWQQRVNYDMKIDMDAAAHRYHGAMTLTYTNNSPDTLGQVFYHQYFNAFQPNSMMDVRSRTIEDADPRVADRIFKLKPDEIGYIKVNSLKHNGKAVKFLSNETILEVTLTEPILPGGTAVFEMEWDAQVPLQIRRSGRDNREGVAYSMSQWYPKLCEYDYQGWHSNPYVAREFYGVWGDYDVTISMDKKYLIAAGSYLQNPQEVGFGYEDPAQPLRLPTGDKLTWHFKTPNVHDFCWAADPEFTQATIKAQDGSTMRFFWQKGKGYDDAWQKLPAIMDRARTHMNTLCGKYPYREYNFIQGGDGGMEYPLATLITGNRPLNSLAGVAIHEQLHSWYQMILGSNESLYAWMDEGFTSYAEEVVTNELAREGLLPGQGAEENPHDGTYLAYNRLASSGKEEPLTTHADHFETNFGYSLAAYVKGDVFLAQLEYVIGKEAFTKGLLRYFDTWKFKHPNANDCVRVFEKQSGLELDWYKEDFVNGLKTVDYAVDSVYENDKNTRVSIKRIGLMAMPLDIVVTYSNGDKETFYAPLESMRGEKPQEAGTKRTLLPDHRWVDPGFTFDIPEKMKKVAKVEIDPTHRMADQDWENNAWEKK
ncbi:MAG TPA: M1 family metallopeptidase [Saprospiraceae bacterium]|nr:M1 family metallopeptidase [Saprospiraceae bacterium]HPI05025.1 M1 family metallopeptidase [Saprospiraceae bacterium]